MKVGTTRDLRVHEIISMFPHFKVLNPRLNLQPSTLQPSSSRNLEGYPNTRQIYRFGVGVKRSGFLGSIEHLEIPTWIPVGSNGRYLLNWRA